MGTAALLRQKDMHYGVTPVLVFRMWLRRIFLLRKIPLTHQNGGHARMLRGMLRWFFGSKKGVSSWGFCKQGNGGKVE